MASRNGPRDLISSKANQTALGCVLDPTGDPGGCWCTSAGATTCTPSTLFGASCCGECRYELTLFDGCPNVEPVQFGGTCATTTGSPRALVGNEVCSGVGAVGCSAETEVCGNSIDDDCDGLADCADIDCTDAPELCDNGIDDNCDPGDDDVVGVCYDPNDDAPGDGDDNDNDGEPDEEDDTEEQCAECGDPCEGEPVHLRTRQMFVGPHRDFAIASGLEMDPSFDLPFTRTYDSVRAGRDHLDDARTGTGEQKPFPRPFGPGWRHSYDTRLILSGVGAPSSPSSILFDTATDTIRLFKINSTTWGRVPGRAIRATKSGSTWSVTVENGDVFEFVENGAVATINHPWNSTNPTRPQDGVQFHLRLKTIKPNGAPHYQIRLFHEQDTDIPANVCNQMPGAVCTASRGLLVAVSALWSTNGTTFVRGSSYHFRWTVDAFAAGTNEKNQYLLSKVIEGADVDLAGTATGATVLVDYTHVGVTGSGSFLWRRPIQRARSGLGNQAAADGSPVYEILYESTASWLIKTVNQPAMVTTNTIKLIPVETFDWDQLLSGKWVVGVHESRGISLSATQDPVGSFGLMSWTKNGEQKTLRYEHGRPVECVRGDCSAPERPRVLERSILNNRYVLGASVTPHNDGSHVLRELGEDGAVLFEAEVIADVRATPAMTVSPGSGFDVLTFTNVNSVRQARRHYYTNDVVPRRIATATRSTIFQPSTLVRFPNDAGAPSSWKYSGTIASRPVVTNVALLGGTNHYFDVTVVDTNDNGPTNTTLNEANEKIPAWTHHALTAPAGALVYRSTRRAVTQNGQTTEERDFATQKSSPTTMRLVGNRVYGYALLTASPHQRGRRTSAFAAHSAGSSGIFKLWDAGIYDEGGRLVSRSEGTSGERSIVETLTVSTTGVQTRTTEIKEGTTVIQSRFTDTLGSGFVVREGTTSGNRTAYRVNSSTVPATHAFLTREKRTLTSADVTVATERFTYDVNGRMTMQEVFEGATTNAVDLRRKTEYEYDSEGRIKKQKQHIDLLGALSQTISVYDPQTNLLQYTTEPDGTDVLYIHGAAGVNTGRVTEVRRDNNVVTGYSYDGEGRKTQVRNGTTPVLNLTYGERGRIIKEENLASGVITERDEDFAVIGSDTFRVEKVTTKSPAGVVQRSVDTYFDNLNRPQMICDVIGNPTCTAPLVDYVYDTKGVYASGTPYTTASGRTQSLTNAQQLGRLAYVTHPGGATFFEYDAPGRVTARVQYEATLGASAIGSNMRAINYSYARPQGTLSSIVYPSNRKVDYTYGNDKRQPLTVGVYLQTSGTQTRTEIINTIVPDVEGSPKSWATPAVGGASSTLTYTRDALARATKIEAVRSGTLFSRLQATFDPDGDVLTQADDAVPSISSFPGSNTNLTHGTHAFRDVLTRWRAFTPWNTAFAADITTTLDSLGRSDTEAHVDNSGTVQIDNTYDATYPERLTRVDRLTTPNAGQRVAMSYYDSGDLLQLTYYLPIRSMSFFYGPRGNVVQTSNSSGTTNHVYSDTMERWKKVPPVAGVEQRFRYGVGGVLLDDQDMTAGSLRRDEYVHLGGQKVAVIHTENAFPTADIFYVLNDRMGLARKAVRRNGYVLAAVVDADAWGGGITRDQRGGTPTFGLPTMNERYPGQYNDGGQGETLVENRWRFLLPWAGKYTAPDPEYMRSSLSYYGPQGYKYAAGAPLRNTDPLGRVTFDRASWSFSCDTCADYNPEPMRQVALAAAQKPQCQSWWSRAFPTGPSLSELLNDSRTRVFFLSTLGDGVGGLAFADNVFLKCRDSNCSESDQAITSAWTLIHELIHVSQYRNLIFGYEWQNADDITTALVGAAVETDPIFGADVGDVECIPY